MAAERNKLNERGIERSGDNAYGHIVPNKSIWPVYEKGAIRRLFLENFVTYSSVEFSPGPHLNVIIGPNGTGKSTIVCGICLGVAGKPGLLGRATSVLDYVKHGCQKAVIEVELNNPGHNPYVIRREISRTSSNHSTWLLNGKIVTQKNVEELVCSLGIQVGNLCQFLPQDKVSDFAKMTQQELLQNTEKTINVQLYEHHVKLSSARNDQRNIEQQLSKTKERLEREVSQNARLEQDVKNNETRESEIKRLKMFKMKRPWVLYEVKRSEFEKKKNMRKETKLEYETVMESYEPLRQRSAEVQQKTQRITREMTQLTNEIRNSSSSVRQSITSMEEIEEKLQEIDQELINKRQDEANRHLRLRDLYIELNAFKSELDNLERQEDLQPAIDRVSEEIRNINCKMSDLKRELDTVKQDVIDIQEGKRGLRDQLNHLQDVGKQRLDNLSRVHRETYQAVLWLRGNQSMFRATIHEPMILTIDVKNPSQAKYVEARIAFRDLRAFICENGEDLELFLCKVRDELKYKVNVVMMPTQPADSFRPKHPIQHYVRFQFHSYIRELFTCPEPVMRYLCLMYNVHSIPVGNKFTKDNIGEIIRSCPELTLMYTDNNEYSIKKSKYSGQSMSNNRELRDPNLLTIAGDRQKEESLLHQLQARETVQKIKEDKQRECEKHQTDQEIEINRLADKKKLLLEKKNEKRTLLQKIAVKEDSIKRRNSEAIDLQQEEENTNAKKKRIEEKQFEQLLKLKQHVQKNIDWCMKKICFGLQHTGCLREGNQLVNELREKESQSETLNNKLSLLTEEVEHMRLAAIKLLNEAQKASNINGNIPQSLEKNFRLLPNTVDEIDSCIHELQARIDCILYVDDSVVRDYHSRRDLISILEKDIKTLQQQLDDHKTEVEKVKERWIVPLQKLINQINQKFSEFFQLINCAGEVDLKVPENPEDFEKYGICIRVKFRDSEQLHELTPFHQSGGERSVSTVLYIMALQELTVCPFRCVDEINQGMDPINERSIFELVVKTATRERTSQYFLLTPKLLPDLKYNNNMTVLFVHNGPYLLDHKECSLTKFLHRRKRIQ